jgi:hypothetical protein
MALELEPHVTIVERLPGEPWRDALVRVLPLCRRADGDASGPLTEAQREACLAAFDAQGSPDDREAAASAAYGQMIPAYFVPG